MDFSSLIEIIIAIVVVYFFIRFVVNPILKVVVGIIIFIVLIYLLQKYLGFNLDKVLAQFGISNWIISPINYYINQAESFFGFIWKNVPKNK